MQDTHRRMLIDTDTASDDAVALIMALRAPNVDVRAITVVNGNVPMLQGAKNARFTAELCEREEVPIHLGAVRPLTREPFDATYFHGKDGLGDIGCVPARFEPDPMPAVEAILKHVREMGEELELGTLGPLTNVALAIRKDPAAMRRVKRCIVMGGNPCCVGNVTPAAEYNIWCDPEAASIVFRSGMNLEMVGWQLSRDKYALNAAEIEHVRNAIGTPLAKFAMDCNGTAAGAFEIQTGQRGIALPDPVAMAVALDPSIVTSASSHRVEVETQSELTRGMTVVDQLNIELGNPQRHLWPSEAGKVSVVWELDAAKWKGMLYGALG